MLNANGGWLPILGIRQKRRRQKNDSVSRDPSSDGFRPRKQLALKGTATQKHTDDVAEGMEVILAEIESYVRGSHFFYSQGLAC